MSRPLCIANSTHRKTFSIPRPSEISSVLDVDFHVLHAISKMFYIMYLTSESTTRWEKLQRMLRSMQA